MTDAVHGHRLVPVVGRDFRGDHAIGGAPDRQVRHVMSERSRAQSGEHVAIGQEIVAYQDRESLRGWSAAERARERDGLRDARVPTFFLHVPARDDAAQAVTDDVHASADVDAIDHPRELLGDEAHGGSRRVRERRHACSLGFEARLQRAPHSRAREEAVHQHDDVIANAMLRHDEPEIVSHQHYLAERRARLGARQVSGQSSLGSIHERA